MRSLRPYQFPHGRNHAALAIAVPIDGLCVKGHDREIHYYRNSDTSLMFHCLLGSGECLSKRIALQSIDLRQFVGKCKCLFCIDGVIALCQAGREGQCGGAADQQFYCRRLNGSAQMFANIGMLA